MKLEFIKEVETPIQSYGYIVKTGDIADLSDSIAKKALVSGDWRKVEDQRRKANAESVENNSDTMQTQDAIIGDLKKENAELKTENKNLKQQVKNLKARGN